MVKFWTYTLKAAIALLGLAGLPFLIKGLPLIYDELMLIYPEYAHLWPLCIGLLAAMAAPLYAAAAGAWWFLSVCNKTWVFGSQQNKPLTLVALCAAADLVLGLVLFLILAANRAAPPALIFYAVPIGIAGLAVIAATRFYREMAKGKGGENA